MQERLHTVKWGVQLVASEPHEALDTTLVLLGDITSPRGGHCVPSERWETQTERYSLVPQNMDPQQHRCVQFGLAYFK